jgi:RNA polymerase sigma-70 factor, ECF subfamily
VSRTAAPVTLIADAMQQVADVSILGAARGGSERAFEVLIGTLVDPGYRLACSMLHDPEAAEDVMQNASLTAWRRLGKVHDERTLRPWFLSIVANECRNARRLRWVARVTVGLPKVVSVRSEEESILRGADLRHAISQLRDADRLIVLLYFYLDLPIDEVASISRISISAARQRLHRAVRRLRPDLELEEALK